MVPGGSLHAKGFLNSTRIFFGQRWSARGRGCASLPPAPTHPVLRPLHMRLGTSGSGATTKGLGMECNEIRPGFTIQWVDTEPRLKQKCIARGCCGRWGSSASCNIAHL